MVQTLQEVPDTPCAVSWVPPPLSLPASSAGLPRGVAQGWWALGTAAAWGTLTIRSCAAGTSAGFSLMRAFFLASSGLEDIELASALWDKAATSVTCCHKGLTMSETPEGLFPPGLAGSPQGSLCLAQACPSSSRGGPASS